MFLRHIIIHGLTRLTESTQDTLPSSTAATVIGLVCAWCGSPFPDEARSTQSPDPVTTSSVSPSLHQFLLPARPRARSFKLLGPRPTKTPDWPSSSERPEDRSDLFLVRGLDLSCALFCPRYLNQCEPSRPATGLGESHTSPSISRSRYSAINGHCDDLIEDRPPTSSPPDSSTCGGSDANPPGPSARLGRLRSDRLTVGDKR